MSKLFNGIQLNSTIILFIPRLPRSMRSTHPGPEGSRRERGISAGGAGGGRGRSASMSSSPDRPGHPVSGPDRRQAQAARLGAAAHASSHRSVERRKYYVIDLPYRFNLEGSYLKIPSSLDPFLECY